MILELLRYGSNFSPLIALVIGVILLKKSRNRTLIYAFLLILNSLLADWISYAFAKIYGSNYVIINGYFFVEIVLLLGFYKEVFKSKIPRFLCYLLITYFVATTISADINHYLAAYFSIHAIVNIIICLLFFYEIYKYESKILIERKPEFWFLTGLLFYFSGSLFTVILSHEILNSHLPWSFMHLANILKNLLFAIGFMNTLRNADG